MAAVRPGNQVPNQVREVRFGFVVRLCRPRRTWQPDPREPGSEPGSRSVARRALEVRAGAVTERRALEVRAGDVLDALGLADLVVRHRPPLERVVAGGRVRRPELPELRLLD